METIYSKVLEQKTNNEVCGERTLIKLRSWLDEEIKSLNEDLLIKKEQQDQTRKWIEKMSPVLRSKKDKEILRAAGSQLIDMVGGMRLLEKKRKVLLDEQEDREVEGILSGKSKKEVVEEITARLKSKSINKIDEEEDSDSMDVEDVERGVMADVTEDKSGMVWGKQTYCNELSSWEDLYEALLFYVERGGDEESESAENIIA